MNGQSQGSPHAPALVAVADDALFDEHRSPEQHPERPARLRGARAGLAASQVADKCLVLAPRDAQWEELGRAHGASYIAQLMRLAGKTGMLDGDTYYSPQTTAATLRATGAALSGVDAVLSGRSQYAMSLSRPPGHHARPGAAMGFCLFNHAAVSAHHALANGARRVLILDWDVHHGNGTEEIFERDPRVLYVSIHQSPQYPGSGAVGDVGLGQGEGSTVNIPLSSGATDATYLAAWDQIVLPIVEQFCPDFTVVSAGYDAHVADPLGGMEVSAKGFGVMTAQLLAVLHRIGKPLASFLLEGGYNVAAVQHSVQATLDAMVEVPGASQNGLPKQALRAEHENQLAASRRVQRNYFSL